MSAKRLKPESGFDTLKTAFENLNTTEKTKTPRRRAGKENNMRNENSGFPIIRLSLLAVGGYLLWRNRFKIQQMLEANGISTPWMTGDVSEAIQSGAAKVSGVIEHGARSMEESKVAV